MSNVKRSTYQKAIEENKKLIAEIKLLVSENPSPEKLLCIAKWRGEFKKAEAFDEMLRAAANQYIKNNSNDLPQFLNKD